MKSCIDVRVQPRSKKPGVEKTGENSYKIRVASPPSEGRANEEVIKLLARHLGLPPSRLRIVRGGASRQKLIRIEGEGT